MPATCCRAPTLDQKIATGFNRNHRGNGEGGIIPEEYAVEYVVDRVETTSTVLLGLTLGCARCHDHKYDPFTQKEFYQLFAYFNNVPERGKALQVRQLAADDSGADRRAAGTSCKQLDRELAAAEKRFASLRTESAERPAKLGDVARQVGAAPLVDPSAISSRIFRCDD